VDDTGRSVDVDADEGPGRLVGSVDAPRCDSHAVVAGAVDEAGAVVEGEPGPEHGAAVGAGDGGVRDRVGELVESGVDRGAEPAPALVRDAVEVGQQLERQELRRDGRSEVPAEVAVDGLLDDGDRAPDPAQPQPGEAGLAQP
jgi:hypothetical protein